MRILLIYFFALFFNSLNAQSHAWTRVNPGGGGAFSTIGAGPTGIILAGSDLSGVYRSINGGATWVVIGATNGLSNTHVSGLGFDPTDGNILFIGTEEGIYRSVDGGLNLLKASMPIGYVTDISICKSNTQIGYATYHPQYDSNQGKIYKTINNGQSWSLISNNTLPVGLRILKVITNPTNPQIIYCLSGQGRFACGDAAVFKSIDGGEHWVNISPDGDEVMDIALDKIDPSILYTTTMHANCNQPYYWTDLLGKMYISTDDGNSWVQKSTHTGVIWCKPSASGTIRLIDPREPWPWNSEAGTWKSIDFGTTWLQTGHVNNWEIGYQNFGNLGDNLFRSYSSSFNGICKTLGTDLSQDKIYWTNAQWAFSSSDEGVTFNALHTSSLGSNWASTGFDNVTMTDLSISESDPNLVFAGYHDIGLWKSEDGGASWLSCNENGYTGDWGSYGGNTFTVATDPDRPLVVWASMQGSWEEEATLLRSTTGGIQGSWIPTNELPTTSLILDITIDKNSPTTNRTLFVTAAGSVYKSIDDGQNWNLVLNNTGCRFIGIHPTNSSIIYAGGESGLFKSTDGGISWISSGLAAMQGSGPFAPRDWSGVSKIRINEQGNIYVSVFGQGKGLYLSSDEGATWQKLKTDNYLRSIALVVDQPNLIYTASSSAFTAGGYSIDSKGVEYSVDGGQTWLAANPGMAYPFAVCIETTNETTPTVWTGVPGSGFQKSFIPDQLLPVTLSTPFTAKLKNESVILHWTIAEETRNAGFDILRSVDGFNWKKLQHITPNKTKNYSIIDHSPIPNLSYYQLIQHDFDHKTNSLGTVSVRYEASLPPTLHPNPTTGLLHLTFAKPISSTVELYIFDQTGLFLLSQKGNQIDLSILPKGLYLLKIITPEKTWHNQVVKF